MSRTALQRIGIAVLILLIGLIAFFALSDKPQDKPEPPIAQKATPTPGASLSKIDQQLPAADPNNYNPNLPQWQEWRRRNAEDPKWEWRVPITLYGQVLDQNDAPVTGAKVTLSWTDLSARGVSMREVITDEQGKLFLSDVNGKHLLVRSIEKEGYKYGEQKQDGFEYAAFFDKNYYVPDPKFPAIFRMHKKAEAESLIVISTKYRIPANGVIALDLKTGRQGGNDVSIALIDNSDPTGKKWVAKVRAPSGGLQAVDNEFATVAPEAGYESEIAIDQDTPRASGFPGGSFYKGGKFYVKTASGYALVEFRMVPGNKSLYFTSYLNPNPNSRNLEFDPTKQAKSP